jgi:predicted nucleic acid-binding protein
VRALVPRAQEAVEWFARVDEGLVRGIVPDLAFAEAANALLGYVRSGALPRGAAEAHLRWLVRSPLEVALTANVAEAAFGIALEHGLSAYDAAYYAAAAAEDATLVTADARLAAAYPRSVLVS